MTKSKLLLMAWLLLSAFHIGAQEPVGYNFSYIAADGTPTTGMVEGVLQADGDTVFVTKVTQLVIDNFDLGGLVDPLPVSVTDLNSPPKVSFSGTSMDIHFCGIANGCVEGQPAIFTDPNDGETLVINYIKQLVTGFSETFNPVRWSLSLKVAPYAHRSVLRRGWFYGLMQQQSAGAD